MKFIEKSEGVLVASGRKIRILETTEATYVKVEVVDTGARLSVDASKLKITHVPSGESTFFRVAPNEEGPDGNTYRLRVEWEEGELTEVADERMTSRSPNARPVRQNGNVLCLTRDNVRWLHGELGDLLATWDGERKARAG